MALTPDQSDAFLREVDDAVREDDILSFWTNYGRLVAVLVIAGLLGFGAWLFWQHQQVAKAEQDGIEFATLLKSAQAAKLDKATFDKLVSKGGAGYRADAELVKAALAGGKDDKKSAIASYDKVIADADAPQPMKDLALIRRTALDFDTMKPAAVVDALKALAVPGNAWFGSAGEMTAIAYLKMNKKQEAGDMFASITRDPQVPESIRSRAGQMAGSLGVSPSAIGNGAEQESAVANAQ